MQEWPVPSNVKQLRGFLGLTGYYKRFIMIFSLVSRPLTQLLKKEGYKWTEEAQQAFETLKVAMMKSPVLALLDFSKPFEVETDASRVGIGEVLKQNGHPVAYMSKNLSTKHQSLLKYLLDQRITTPTQMKWLPKLMGFDYEVVYKRGSENGAADALSRIQSPELFSMLTTLVAQAFLDNVYKLHGMPESIVFDRDKVFLSNFWCMTGEHPKEWAKWLSLAKLWYNFNFHTSIQSTPFEIVYGIAPPIHVPYLGGMSKVEAVNRTLKAREEAIRTIKFHFLRAQNRMKQQADKGSQPLTILDRRIVKKRNAVAIYGLVQWTNNSKEDATWELLDKMGKDYPEFDFNS
ncbi:putative mitochondrial protein [Tanacetum coccineum]